jgi:hypothetical protein
MAQTTSRELLKARAGLWLKNAAIIEAELRANPWWKPLLAAFTAENASVDAERAGNLEWRKENENRWHVWRHLLRQLLDDCRGYVNDRAPEQLMRLENIRLFRIAALPDSEKGFVERLEYSKDLCLADLQRTIDLVKGISLFVRASKMRKPLPDICARLRRARRNDTGEQAAAAITSILTNLGTRRKKPLGQPEYHRWEHGRKPTGVNLEACKAYIKERSKRSKKTRRKAT